ncbi:hypothetical protein Nepgr_004088 [Nepenthes gracilis]|uniref:Uncharacterized protein n=1 Tax=Nepenthes gracilis TaxID=150966 RepID=A0AAD3XEL7_NEPGR|nr:hypothetical protein Nepgr_004088 [Nepenthes gracilis]
MCSVVYENNFSGVIPKQLGKLKTLEMLCCSKFEGSIPRELEDFSSPKELQFDPKLAPVVSSGTGYIIRKSGNKSVFD